MLLALDVHYREKEAKAVGVLFNWDDSEPKETIIEYIGEINEYIPGEFYKRELPCLLKVIEKINIDELEAIIIDGYVYVDNFNKYGLGGMLWESLKKQIPVIGVAKTSFYNNKSAVQEIYRGKSNKPIYVSSVGITLENSSLAIKNLHGNYRIPTILKELDKITKD